MTQAQILWDTNPGFPSTTEFKDYTQNAVKYSDNVWYLNDHLRTVDASNLNAPKLYAWVTESAFEKREPKEGQTNQETAGQRVAQYQTIEKRIIIDIIIDKVFLEAGQDQKFHGFRETIHDGQLKWLKDERASDEVIYYKDWDSFYSSPALRREALQQWTNNVSAGRRNLEQRVPSLLMLIAFFTNRNPRDPVLLKMHIFELCARFGKTIWALSLFQLSNCDTLVFGAYYLSSFGSIKNELSAWSQFSDVRYVDTRHPGWEGKHASYIKDGYKVVVLCSLQATDSGWAKVEKWYDNNDVGMVILDEVDFGVHTDRTSNRLLGIIAKSEVIGMSGTNADRMNNGIIDIHRFESYTMEQMLELKHALVDDKSIAANTLAEAINVVPGEFWNGVNAKDNLNEIPELSFFQRTVLAETDMTFSKLLSDPKQYKGVIHRDSLILAGADDEFSHLSIDNVVDKATRELAKMSKPAEHELIDVIEFVGYTTTLENLNAYASFRQQGFDSAKFKCLVVPIHGGMKHIRDSKLLDEEGNPIYKKGQGVDTETSEHYAKDMKDYAEKEGYDRIWIIASGMCQRSFGVGSLSVELLSFDKGESGGVNQRISRLGSPYLGKSAGLVISNSFANERDEKIQMLLYKMAKSRASRTGEDLHKAMRDVKLSLSIFKLGEDGRAIQYEIDEYLAELAKNKTGIRANVCKTLTRVITEMDASTIEAFKQGTTGNGKPQTKLDSTFYDKKSVTKGMSQTVPGQKDVNEVLKVVENLVNNAHLIDALGQSTGSRIGFIQSVKNICLDEALTQEFVAEFKLTPNLFYAIITTNRDIELDIETTLSLNLKSDRELINKYYV